MTFFSDFMCLLQNFKFVTDASVVVSLTTESLLAKVCFSRAEFDRYMYLPVENFSLVCLQYIIHSFIDYLKDGDSLHVH